MSLPSSTRSGICRYYGTERGCGHCRVYLGKTVTYQILRPLYILQYLIGIMESIRNDRTAIDIDNSDVWCNQTYSLGYFVTEDALEMLKIICSSVLKKWTLVHNRAGNETLIVMFRNFNNSIEEKCNTIREIVDTLKRLARVVETISR